MPENTIDQFADLHAAIARNLPRNLLGTDAQYWVQNQAKLKKVLDRALRRTVEARSNLIIDYSLPLDPIFENEGLEPVTPESRRDKVEIDPEKIALTLTLKKDEECVTGEENLKRLQALKNQDQLDAYVFVALFRRPDLIPLEWDQWVEEKKTGGIYFWGTIFRNVHGDLFVACLCWSVGWHWRYERLSGNWDLGKPAATLESSATSP